MAEPPVLLWGSGVEHLLTYGALMPLLEAALAKFSGGDTAEVLQPVRSSVALKKHVGYDRSGTVEPGGFYFKWQLYVYFSKLFRPKQKICTSLRSVEKMVVTGVTRQTEVCCSLLWSVWVTEVNLKLKLNLKQLIKH